MNNRCFSFRLKSILRKNMICISKEKKAKTFYLFNFFSIARIQKNN